MKFAFVYASVHVNINSFTKVRPQPRKTVYSFVATSLSIWKVCCTFQGKEFMPILIYDHPEEYVFDKM